MKGDEDANGKSLYILRGFVSTAETKDGRLYLLQFLSAWSSGMWHVRTLSRGQKPDLEPLDLPHCQSEKGDTQSVRLLILVRAYQSANRIFLSQQTSMNRTYQLRNKPTNRLIYQKILNAHPCMTQHPSIITVFCLLFLQAGQHSLSWRKEIYS